MTKKTKKPEEVKEVVTPEVVVEDTVIEDAALELTVEDAAKEIRKMLSDNEGVALAEAAVQDNELQFKHNDKTYRVRKATYLEKQEANKFRMKKYVELLRDPDTLLERDLRKLYKDKGVDIDGIEKELTELYNTQQSLMLELGKAIQNKKPVAELEKYKAEVVQCNSSMQRLNQEKQALLEYSLENRILMEVYGYMIWQISEVKEGETWKRLWKTYDACQADTDAVLLGLITKHGAVIVTDEMTSNLQT